MPDPTKEEEEEGFNNPDRFGDIGLDWLTIIKPEDDEASKKEDVADPEEEKQTDAR